MNRFINWNIALILILFFLNGSDLQAQDKKSKSAQEERAKAAQNNQMGKARKALNPVTEAQEAGQKKEEEKEVTYGPEWLAKAVIYEVNVRQYTEEGTFEAFAQHLPRLQQMGVDIIWLMPIHPISEKKRKGSLGSYYASADYKAINPEFGNERDLKNLVEQAHDLGMIVILDWVANHSGWDNVWIEEHPDYYAKNEKGQMYPPVEDWSDVAQFNFENKEFKEAMIDAMAYWIKNFDIDGFRCDVAGMVPTEFWNEASARLNKQKDIFLLAEAEQPDHHDQAFDMSYAWELHHLFNKIAKGEKTAQDLAEYLKKDLDTYPKEAFRMVFTSNHDENTWNGTVEERLGEATHLMAVLSFTLPGMPLIYSGQETGLNHRLAFFDKDQIKWDGKHPMMDFYKKLIDLKTNNSAFWSGEKGASLVQLQVTNPNVFVFARNNGDNTALVIVNLSDEKQMVEIPSGKKFGADLKFVMGDKNQALEDKLEMKPFGYYIYKSE